MFSSVQFSWIGLSVVAYYRLFFHHCMQSSVVKHNDRGGWVAIHRGGGGAHTVGVWSYTGPIQCIHNDTCTHDEFVDTLVSRGPRSTVQTHAGDLRSSNREEPREFCPVLCSMRPGHPARYTYAARATVVRRCQDDAPTAQHGGILRRGKLCKCWPLCVEVATQAAMGTCFS